MILRTFTLLTFTLLTTLGFSQEQFSFVLKGQIFGTESDTIRMFQNFGSENVEIATIDLNEKGFFEEKITVTDKDYYILSLEDNQVINIIIEGPDTISIYGDGSNLLYHTNIVGSPSSSALLDFMRINTQYKIQLDSANRYLQANQDKKAEIQKEFQSTYQAFMGQRKLYINENGDSPALIGVVPSVNIEQEFELYEEIVGQLDASFGHSPTVQRIVKEFAVNKQETIAKMPFAPGTEVKEITLPNPEGDTLRLSDYKGKVVLIDFWAAWCGPCRRENPNVVNLYNKYNSKGFEVFSVSLDKDRTKWLAAIEQDGLVWDTHVSDLKGWSSAAGRDYNVTSIPFTVLIDGEGKVIGTNLRGEGLANKLQSIFE
jgi:thiol-disulfide isomerase/thioredoxin